MKTISPIAAAVFLAGLVVGSGAVVAGEAFWSKSRWSQERKFATMERCVDAANLVMKTEGSEEGRIIRIAACMGANGYLFTGSMPDSHCYAQHSMQLRIKHILPSCYTTSTILSKVAR